MGRGFRFSGLGFASREKKKSEGKPERKSVRKKNEKKQRQKSKPAAEVDKMDLEEAWLEENMPSEEDVFSEANVSSEETAYKMMMQVEESSQEDLDTDAGSSDAETVPAEQEIEIQQEAQAAANEAALQAFFTEETVQQVLASDQALQALTGSLLFANLLTSKSVSYYRQNPAQAARLIQNSPTLRSLKRNPQVRKAVAQNRYLKALFIASIVSLNRSPATFFTVRVRNKNRVVGFSFSNSSLIRLT